MPIAYWCVLIAALLPLPLVAYAKAGARDNNAPRDAAEKLSGPRRRAYAAHQNAYENFPFFGVAVVAALALNAPTATLNMLAMAYIVLRVVYALLYINDVASARSLVYLGALLVNVAIFVLPTFK